MARIQVDNGEEEMVLAVPPAVLSKAVQHLAHILALVEQLRVLGVLGEITVSLNGPKED